MNKTLLSASLLSAPILSLALSFSAIFPTRAAKAVPQPGYSTETLQDPIFTPSEVATETQGITRWLSANYQSLSYEQANSIRERLYYLIDSRVKEIYAQSGVILPAEPDPILERLFAWVEPLGVYGGNLAYSAVNSATASDIPSALPIPSSMDISLEGDLLTVRAADWDFDVPYYFMITDLKEFDLPSGMPAQGTFLSTGATEDATPLGYSQATLVYIYAPNAQASDLSHVRQSFKISEEAAEQSLEGIAQNSYYELDSENGLDLHKEIITWEDESGAYTVIYLGADGTYQWNRPHFLDFVASIQDR